MIGWVLPCATRWLAELRVSLGEVGGRAPDWLKSPGAGWEGGPANLGVWDGVCVFVCVCVSKGRKVAREESPSGWREGKGGRRKRWEERQVGGWRLTQDPVGATQWGGVTLFLNGSPKNGKVRGREEARRAGLRGRGQRVEQARGAEGWSWGEGLEAGRWACAGAGGVREEADLGSLRPPPQPRDPWPAPALGLSSCSGDRRSSVWA